jgi:hypothetical protein
LRLRLAAVLAAVVGAGPGCVVDTSRGADLGPAGMLSGYGFTTPAGRWQLPDELAEVSGLVDDGAGGLLAHHDNGAALWRMSLGPTLHAVPVPGDSRPAGDFEGIARQGGTLWLLASPGVVYRSSMTPAGTTAWRQESAAARGVCGFEGVETAPEGGLLLACKYPRNPQPGLVWLYRLAPGGGSVRAVAIDVAAVLEATGLRRLRPSGLAWLPDRDPRTGPHGDHLLVLAGKERVLLEVDPATARVLAWRRLSRAWHRQAEGVAVLADGVIVIADEADGRTATLTAYAPTSP